MQILARWLNETRYDLLIAEQRISRLEARVDRLEQAVRRQALARRHWIRNGHPERV